MPQLHFSVSEDSAAGIRRRAEARGVSVSKLLAEIVEREVGGGWPPGWFDAVIGSWQGEFERPPQGDVEVREEL